MAIGSINRYTGARPERTKLWLKKYGLPTAILVTFVVGVGATHAAAAPVLSLVGFGPQGPEDGTWAARRQKQLGDVKAGSSFTVAQSIGMGGPVPWYGYILGGAILVLFVLTIYGLGRVLKCCFSRRQRRDWTPLKNSREHFES